MLDLLFRVPGLRRVAEFFAATEPVASVEAVTAVVSEELVAYDPTDACPRGFVVTEGGVAGMFVVHYPFNTDAPVLVDAWLFRACRVLRAAGYQVSGDVRDGQAALLVTVG